MVCFRFTSWYCQKRVELMKELDLGWGDPHFLLEILGKTYSPPMGSSLAPQNCTYAPECGDETLLRYVRDITEHTTGLKYKYYLITNGATQALNTVMRVWKDRYCHKNVVTSQLGYPYYPDMVGKTDLNYVKTDLKTYEADEKDIILVDSPSNPLGDQSARTFFTNTVWDAVYHNQIYNACPAIKPVHKAYVGSFSKLLGLTGARVGWIATNDICEFDDFRRDSLMENATVSKLSQKYVKNVLEGIDLIEFMRLGKNSLDQNREELQKLSSLLGSNVQEKGMFYSAEVDLKMYELFQRAEVKFVPLSYDDKLLIRLNIGQTNDILKKAVKAIQKTDRRK